MSRGLAALGLDMADIARILVTHAHWDHYSQAYQWKLERGTEILVGRGEHHSIDTWGVYDTAFPLQVDLLKRAGDEQRATTLETLQLAEIERHMRAPSRGGCQLSGRSRRRALNVSSRSSADLDQKARSETDNSSYGRDARWSGATVIAQTP